MTYYWGENVARQEQIRQFQEQQKIEIFKERYTGAMALLDDISTAASDRLMNMERVLWVIKGTSDGDVKETWDEYYKTVLNWNVKQLVFKTRLLQYVGDGVLIFP